MIHSVIGVFGRSLLLNPTTRCGNCKALEPTLEKAAALLPPGSIAKVDATAVPALKELHKIEGYPALLIIKDGEANTVQTRTTNAIVSLVNKASRPVISVLDSVSALEQMTLQGDVFVTYVGPAGENLNPLFEAFFRQAHKHLEVTNVFFAQVDEADQSGLLGRLGVPAGSTFPLVTVCTGADARCGGSTGRSKRSPLSPLSHVGGEEGEDEWAPSTASVDSVLDPYIA
jgi:thiol-disulfide isomerase/thioredoxin